MRSNYYTYYGASDREVTKMSYYNTIYESTRIYMIHS